MMKSKMKLMPLLVSVTLISGCTVLPGSNMSTMGKDVIKQQDADFDLDKMVNVYPLTPRLIDQLRPRPNVARPNMTLESEIANYQYRVGPGDYLLKTLQVESHRVQKVQIIPLRKDGEMEYEV